MIETYYTSLVFLLPFNLWRSVEGHRVTGGWQVPEFLWPVNLSFGSLICWSSYQPPCNLLRTVGRLIVNLLFPVRFSWLLKHWVLHLETVFWWLKHLFSCHLHFHICCLLEFLIYSWYVFLTVVRWLSSWLFTTSCFLCSYWQWLKLHFFTSWVFSSQT